MSERNGYAHGVPCWVDTWRDDVDGAVGFYTELFGWEAARGEYSMFQLRGRDVAGIGARAGAPGGVDDVRVGGRRRRDRRGGDRGGRHADRGAVRQPRRRPDRDRRRSCRRGVRDLAARRAPRRRAGERARRVGDERPRARPTPRARTRSTAPCSAGRPRRSGRRRCTACPATSAASRRSPSPRDVIAVMMPGEHAAWMPDFWVHDADAAAATVARLGGTVIAPPADDRRRPHRRRRRPGRRGVLDQQGAVGRGAGARRRPRARATIGAIPGVTRSATQSDVHRARQGDVARAA